MKSARSSTIKLLYDSKAHKRFRIGLTAPANRSLSSPREQKSNKLKSFSSFIILSAAIFYALAPY
jgi:hypothetical protein